ncbi:hypothetical protein BU23DRAFT_564984 [Bimuria novae-zelandiae CBS 107.79]|uniref:Uncharacterized protein n=1 Tax=Bimuria novae-zelandiae CBS 107.79 TaxID=1447943 RepID=A0A6A5VLB5_9PLEO|nr:hypothetical protein BU23DRAFT_564984 [Bimuria novae-zelandiae CBS 107.79]
MPSQARSTALIYTYKHELLLVKAEDVLYLVLVVFVHTTAIALPRIRSERGLTPQEGVAFAASLSVRHASVRSSTAAPTWQIPFPLARWVIVAVGPSQMSLGVTPFLACPKTRSSSPPSD